MVGLCRTTGAAHATARSSAWFQPSPFPALPTPATAAVVSAAIRSIRCREYCVLRATCCVQRAAYGKEARGERGAACGVRCGGASGRVASGGDGVGCGVRREVRRVGGQSDEELAREAAQSRRKPSNDQLNLEMYVDGLALRISKFVQTVVQNVVWARYLSKRARFGQEICPSPTFGFGKRPVGERFVVSIPKIKIGQRKTAPVEMLLGSRELSPSSTKFFFVGPTAEEVGPIIAQVNRRAPSSKRQYKYVVLNGGW
jgi:hypothetical protein